MSRQEASTSTGGPPLPSDGSTAQRAAPATGTGAAPAGALPPRNHTHNTRSKKEAAAQDLMAPRQVVQQLPAQQAAQAAGSGAAMANGSAVSLLLRPGSPASPRAASRQPKQQAAATAAGVSQPAVEGTVQHPPLPRSPRAAAARRRQAAEQVQPEQPGAGAEQEAKGQGPAERQAGQQGPAAAEQGPEEQASQPSHRRQRPRKPALKSSEAASGAATGTPSDVQQQQQQQQDTRQQEQQQQQQRQATAAAPQHGHNTRLQEREAARRVCFAPGPWADKFSTQDGHPDHEGQLARQRRSAGARWGTDLTPSAVRAVEAELGEECRPSIDRLKRRVGLLPLRKRSREHYLLINGGSLQDAASLAAAASGKELGAPPGGSPAGASSCDEAQQPAKRARGVQRAAAAAAALPQRQEHQQQPVATVALAGGHAAANGTAAKGGAEAGASKAGKPGAGLPGAGLPGAANSSVPPRSPVCPGAAPTAGVTFGRKRGASHADVATAALNGTAAAAHDASGGPSAKRASQRLGGLAGPVGLLGGFSRRNGAGGS